MKLRLISDVHIDVNSNYNVNLNKGKTNNVFTLVAGDISGHPDATTEWVKKNMKGGGVFISGNHDVYNQDHIPLETIKETLHERFPVDGKITYLDFDVGTMTKELEDGTLIVGDVLYTDYALPVDGNDWGDVERNMFFAVPRMSKTGLNDFFWGRTKDLENGYVPTFSDLPDGVAYLQPKVYLNHFNRAFEKITEIVEKNKDRNIILMTHHCLHKNCISRMYCEDQLNASYVSDKEQWILDHPNIRLILSGHVHIRKHFKVGSTLYVLNPLGYCKDQWEMVDEETNERKTWTPNCFVDTETWELTYEPWSNPKWDKKYEEHAKTLLAMAAFCM